MHLCVAGWLDGGKAGYPTRYPSVTCGDNHVGLVLYKEPMDQSSKYDAYCYRLRGESVCVCVCGQKQVLPDLYSHFNVLFTLHWPLMLWLCEPCYLQ